MWCRPLSDQFFDKELEYETILLAGPEELTFNELVDRIVQYFEVRRFKLHLSAGLIKFGTTVLTSFGVKFLMPDQISRLLYSKYLGVGKTSALIFYSPRKLEEGMTAYYKS
jgi:hypothetical protein